MQFKNSMEKVEIPFVDNVLIIHYDEQHPKKGRCQKFRSTRGRGRLYFGNDKGDIPYVIGQGEIYTIVPQNLPRK